MLENAATLRVRIVTGIASVKAREWDACANPEDQADGHAIPGNPFLSHAFLNALEVSGSATPETGWAPHHLLLEDDGGNLLAAIPLYLKSHSYGEYVFDHAWADAWHRAGGEYYPKLQACVPFTPAPGRRILLRPHADAARHRDLLIQACQEIAERAEVSSLHFTFLQKTEWEALAAKGFLQRTDFQFHWLNQNFHDFEDFLGSLTARKRKQIRRERRAALENGVEVTPLTGKDITEEHWDAFYQCYLSTGRSKWGRPYLTRKLFSVIGETMPEKILLILCRRAGRTIAGAINFIGDEALYGRNWGCIEEHPFLHFEACYYQAIDFAIARGLARVEAGAQGAHKLARGYLPCPTYSAHWIRDSRFRAAVSDYLVHERAQVSESAHYLEGRSPFRRIPEEEVEE
ncbi:MAG TPA: GNAT family N-acetyltransferase [Alphaproteobacteria bacterium]|jgi:uncharacterized protein|nr:GNAT family N-acetyltransferase [Alphaproteobacteria bacterium]